MSERFEIEIYAYVLMDSHYHLLLRTMRPNLSNSMQWLGTRYTRCFNLRNLQSGHLFQGRFKSIIVENDAYLLRLSCYIHCNPLSAGIVDRLLIATLSWLKFPDYLEQVKKFQKFFCFCKRLFSISLSRLHFVTIHWIPAFAGITATYI